jgi:integrase
MPRLKTIRPKWAPRVDQAATLAAQLPWLLPRTLVGLALLTGLRRGELFALRWWDIDEPNRSLQVRAAVYAGVFDDPKTLASLRTIPLPNTARQLLAEWKGRAKRTAA